jgi:hypothetical protein
MRSDRDPLRTLLDDDRDDGLTSILGQGNVLRFIGVGSGSGVRGR